MQQAVEETNFTFPKQTSFYRGKVRDVYTVEGRLIMVASDRISAFDHVLPRPIPYKGQVLNQLALHFLKATRDIVPNWLMDSPDPNVSIGCKCKPYKIEMVMRGYLTGHAWRVYRSGKRVLCGVPLPDGMRENDRFPEPIITPSTKAASGHDEDISKEEIIERGLATEEEFAHLEAYSILLFQRGSKMAKERGLILVDTKYEFGKKKGKIYLIDEIHTPDSSRYFYRQGYDERQARGQKQMQLSKEFVREWLMENGFQGIEGQTMPIMPDAFVEQVSTRYIHLYELITGKKFKKVKTKDLQHRIENNVLAYLQIND